jgi:hypothetical protein
MSVLPTKGWASLLQGSYAEERADTLASSGALSLDVQVIPDL